MSPMFSVCMPTYKRAELLPGCFAAFAAQTWRDFEVVIIDDGSPDDTPRVLAELSAQADFAVRVVRVENGGRGRALNRALDEAQGTFILFMDDDDLLDPHGLERLAQAWASIPERERDAYCGVAGLCTYPDGRLIGDRYPDDLSDSDFFTVREIRGVRGDKKEAVRRACIGDWRFTIEGTERRAPTASLWFHLATQWRARFVNEIIAIKDYRPEGMSANLRRIRAKSAVSTCAFYENVLLEHERMPYRLRVRYLANLTRFRRHAGLPGLPGGLVTERLSTRVPGAMIGEVAYRVDRFLLERA